MEFDLKFGKKRFKMYYLWDVKKLHIISGKITLLSSQCKWRINTSIDYWNI